MSGQLCGETLSNQTQCWSCFLNKNLPPYQLATWEWLKVSNESHLCEELATARWGRSQPRPRQRQRVRGRQTAPDRGWDLINDQGVMRPGSDTWHLHGKKIHQCKSSSVTVVEKNSDPAKRKSHQHLNLAFLSQLIQLSSIHPSLFQQHLHSHLTLSLSLSPLRPFPLLRLPMSRYLMFLSPLLIPNLHPIQAGCFHWGADVRKDKLWSLRKHCVLFESFCLRADFSSRKKQGRLEWRGRGCEEAAGWAGDMLTDAARFRTCRGSCSWEAEVKRGKEI